MDDPRLFGAVKFLEALDATGEAICALYDMDCNNCPMDLPHFDTCLGNVISNVCIGKKSELEKETDHDNP